MEINGPADEPNSSLRQLSRYRRELAADGPIRREAFCRYDALSSGLGVTCADDLARSTRPRLAGTLFRASQFLAEELPIRLAHRVQELENLPDGLNEMPSVRKVKDWYAQSFEVRNINQATVNPAISNLSTAESVTDSPALHTRKSLNLPNLASTAILATDYCGPADRLAGFQKRHRIPA